MNCGWCFGICSEEDSKHVTTFSGDSRRIHYRCSDLWDSARTGRLQGEKTALKEAFDKAEKPLNKKERKAVRQERARNRQ